MNSGPLSTTIVWPAVLRSSAIERKHPLVKAASRYAIRDSPPLQGTDAKGPGRPDVTNHAIEFVVNHARAVPDRRWPDARNAIARVPPSGRRLKVVFKPQRDAIFVITAYWLD